jgi:hypothetical protein
MSLENLQVRKEIQLAVFFSDIWRASVTEHSSSPQNSLLFLCTDDLNLYHNNAFQKHGNQIDCSWQINAEL